MNYKIPVMTLAVLAVSVIIMIPTVAGQTEQSELDKLKIKYQTLQENYELINANLISRSLDVTDLIERELRHIKQIKILWERIGEKNKEIIQLEKKLTVIPELNQYIRELKIMVEDRDDKILSLENPLNDTEIIPVQIDETQRLQEIEIRKIHDQIYGHPEYVNISDDYFFLQWHLTTNTYDPIFSFNMIWEQHLKANFPEQLDTLVTVTVKDPNGRIVQSHLYTITDDVDSFYDLLEHDNFVEPGIYTITLNYTQPDGKLKGELVGKIYYIYGEMTHSEKINYLEKQLEFLKNYNFKVASD